MRLSGLEYVCTLLHSFTLHPTSTLPEFRQRVASSRFRVQPTGPALPNCSLLFHMPLLAARSLCSASCYNLSFSTLSLPEIHKLTNTSSVPSYDIYSDI